MRQFSEPSDGHIHTDYWSKIITLLVYFNPEWTQEGGRLRMLRCSNNIDDYTAEVAPLGGTVLAFRRSERSWHGYKRFDGERRMIQMSWVKPNRLAWYAQQTARLGTQSVKRLALGAPHARQRFISHAQDADNQYRGALLKIMINRRCDWQG